LALLLALTLLALPAHADYYYTSNNGLNNNQNSGTTDWGCVADGMVGEGLLSSPYMTCPSLLWPLSFAPARGWRRRLGTR